MASPTLAQVCKGRAPDVVIGVDTHKDVHVAVALAPNGGRLGEHRIPTTRKGYDDLIVWSEEFGSNPVYAIEGTSSYGAGLTRELLDASFPVVEVNRTDRSVRRRLGKDVDAVFREAVAIDAEAAARAYLAGTATATPKTGADQVEMIRML
jgi:transposase